MLPDSYQKALVLVAHPDDEALWMGGTILMYPAWDWEIISLCRRSDPDRATRFHNALQIFHATGQMGDLDDEPEQRPLSRQHVQESILSLLPNQTSNYDIIFTHSPSGEYTRHRRHEEVSRAVLTLWEHSQILAKKIWLFAYEDGERAYLPQAIPDAHHLSTLPDKIWQQKYEIVTTTYGFDLESFEARTTPRREAFWCLNDPAEVNTWFSLEVEK